MTKQDVVAKIAEKLDEKDEAPLRQIDGVVDALGEDKSLEVLNETLDVEAKGGMMLPNGERRRTPGGVFFFLARQQLSREQRKLIFEGKVVKQSAEPPRSTRPRPKIIDVAAESPAAVAYGGKFKPPELDDAVARARVRRQVKKAIAKLSAAERYHLLIDIAAGLYDKVHSTKR